MGEITTAELALLSLLAEKPRHAYEIEQVIEERNLRDWTDLGFSSIYRLLTKFEKKGFARGEMAPPKGRGPARKVYHLTDKGKKSWENSALQHLSNPNRNYSSFLLALDNLYSLPKEAALNALSKYLGDQTTIHNHLSDSLNSHPKKDDFYIRSFFDYILHQQKAEIDWLQVFIRDYRKHTSGV